MILEVLANTGQVNNSLDTGRLEKLLRADTADLEDLGRVNGTSGDDDLLASIDSEGLRLLLEFDTGGLAALEENAATRRVGQDVVVGSVEVLVVGVVRVRALPLHVVHCAKISSVLYEAS